MNFHRRRPRAVAKKRYDWSTWGAHAVIRRLFRQSGTARPDRPLTQAELERIYADEAAMWEQYLRDNEAQEEW